MKLPSRLTTFERFLYYDDYPAYPNTIACRLNFLGEFDPEKLHVIAGLLYERHPLLQAKVDHHARRPVWDSLHPRPDPQQLSGQTVDRAFIKKIDLQQEVGGQLHWAQNDHRVQLNFLTHHAVADGLGGLQVVFDFLLAYSCLVENQPRNLSDAIDRMKARLGRQDQSLLNRRGKYGFCSFRFLRALPRQSIGLLGVREFFANRPETLTTERHGDLDQPIPESYPGVYFRELGDIQWVRDQAGQAKVSTNDLILQAIFLALAKWREKHRFGSDQDLLRLMVPINLRTISDRYLPASHRSSMVTLDRVQADCRDADRLLKSIRFQMNVIKQNGLGYTFLHMLNLFRWFPGGIRRFADPDRVGSTMVVTNLGEPFRRIKLPRNRDGRLIVGKMVLQNFDLIAPLRPNTQAALAIGRYANKAFLTLTYDHRCLSPPLACELADQICEEFVARARTAG